MVLIRVERAIAAPPERIWPYIDDVKKVARWFAPADDGEILEGEGKDRMQRMYGRWGGKLSEVDQRVTRYEPGHRIAWVHVAERLDGEPAPEFARATYLSITLRPHDVHTTVRIESRQEPASAFKGLIMSLGRRRMRALLQRSLRDLQALVESTRRP